MLYFVALAVNLVLAVATIRYLWKPANVGIKIGIASIVAGLLYVVGTAALALADIESLRAYIAADLAARGQQSMADTLSDDAVRIPLMSGIVAAVCLSAFEAWLFVWNRPYFSGEIGKPST